MPLTPPPDYTRVFASAVLGATLALIAWTLSRNTLPQVGDREHYLPHGGFYRDGTKVVRYFGPSRLNSLEGRTGGGLWQPWAVVVVLVAAIVGLSRGFNQRCAKCGQCH